MRPICLQQGRRGKAQLLGGHTTLLKPGMVFNGADDGVQRHGWVSDSCVSDTFHERFVVAYSFPANLVVQFVELC